MGVNLEKIKKKVREQRKQTSGEYKRKTNYELIRNNKNKVVDVQLLFGQFKGHLVSEMTNDPRAINYVQFLLNPANDFPPEFMKYVKRVFDKHYDNFLDDDIPFLQTWPVIMNSPER